MLSSLITSQTRIKLLKKFFLNSCTKAHLRGLESEFGESSNGIRVELNRFENAGLLTSSREGNKKLYQANKSHPLYQDIHNIIMKETGIDRVIENVIHRIGNLLCVYLTGDFACGKDGKVIDLILVGDDINKEYLNNKVVQAEKMVGREVHYTLVCPEEAEKRLVNYKSTELLPLWYNDERQMTLQ
jgi:DNA-binding transcriptional ArsR family regulator